MKDDWWLQTMELVEKSGRGGKPPIAYKKRWGEWAEGEDDRNGWPEGAYTRSRSAFTQEDIGGAGRLRPREASRIAILIE